MFDIFKVVKIHLKIQKIDCSNKFYRKNAVNELKFNVKITGVISLHDCQVQSSNHCNC